MFKYSIVVLAALVTACSSTTKVSTKSAEMAPAEVFWAKNQLAMTTELPGEARFQNFEVLALDNGDRVYCGDMSSVTKTGAPLGFVPFYMRQRDGKVAAMSTGSDSADFARKTCAEARSGALRVSKA